MIIISLKEQYKKNYGDLKGVYNLSAKVKRKIESYLLHGSYLTCKHIHVFIAYDLEETRENESELDIKSLKKEFITPESRIKSINEIVATQDLESWFFHDLEGIYKYLKVPKSKRNMTAYNNIEATNNRILSSLFHRFKYTITHTKRHSPKLVTIILCDY